MIKYNDQRVGIFIDVQNMYYSARNLHDRKVNFGNVVKNMTGDRQLIRAFAYVVTTKTGENQPFIDALSNLGIETREKELLEFFSGQKKADWDVGITVDAIRLADSLDVIVIISGDGDFVPLVEYLQSKGKIVEVGAFRKTTSTSLVDAVGAEHYVDFSQHMDEFLVKDTRAHLNRRAAIREEKYTDSDSGSGSLVRGRGVSLGHGAEKSGVSMNAGAVRNGVAGRGVVKRSAVKKEVAKKEVAKKGLLSKRVARKNTVKKAAPRVRKVVSKKVVKKDNFDDGLSANERALNN